MGSWLSGSYLHISGNQLQENKENDDQWFNDFFAEPSEKEKQKNEERRAAQEQGRNAMQARLKAQKQALEAWAVTSVFHWRVGVWAAHWMPGKEKVGTGAQKNSREEGCKAAGEKMLALETVH